MNEALDFASFDSNFEKSRYVLVGVPYDGTSSFRLGSSKGPQEIRRASYCFEPYLLEHDISLEELSLHDFGDIDISNDHDELRDRLTETVQDIVSQERFPIVVGGEHSLSPIVVSTLKEKYEGLDVLILDAHLDFRDRYEGMEYSHATVTRRVSEIVGPESTVVWGVRSMAKKTSEVEKPDFITCDELQEGENKVEEVLQNIDKPIYLSIDMDVIDPSYSPGVGNPEPFGIRPQKIKELIDQISSHLVGVDIVETCPKYDSSNITSNLASRFIYEIIGSREDDLK